MAHEPITFRIYSEPSITQTCFWVEDMHSCGGLTEYYNDNMMKTARTNLVFVATIPKFKDFKMSPLFNSLTGILGFDFESQIKYDYRTILYMLLFLSHVFFNLFFHFDTFSRTSVGYNGCARRVAVAYSRRRRLEGALALY